MVATNQIWAVIMFPQHLKTRRRIRAAGIRTKLAMVTTLALSTLIALAGLPALASTSAMSHEEIQALATMIAAPVAIADINATANTIVLAIFFCLMAGMALVLGHSLKHDLETAGRVRP